MNVLSILNLIMGILIFICYVILGIRAKEWKRNWYVIPVGILNIVAFLIK